MRIEDVITRAIIAICQNQQLSELLILKGGSAMRLFDGLDSRLSVDADFSVRSAIDPGSAVFAEMEASLGSSFAELGYEVIDFRVAKKPKRLRKGFPEWWGGWACEFKLVADEYRVKTLETKRRNALIPEGAPPRSKITIDLSEHEYCGEQRDKWLEGTRIRAYSREMLVIEKLRAICQQHPEYPYRQPGKNRARDFFDIYELSADADDDFASRCRAHLNPVFDAKEVPLWILSSLWSDTFIDEMQLGFEQVKNTVRGRMYEFEVYVEHLRFLVKEICPSIPPRRP
jgi:hypothetical protein